MVGPLCGVPLVSGRLLAESTAASLLPRLSAFIQVMLAWY